MRTGIVTLVAAAAMVSCCRQACAQRATIQQPVIGRFGVATTVSVPDSGRAMIGSLSRAGDSRKSFGPFGLGSSRGSFRNHSGVSVSATIHDFEEMDRRLLGRSSKIPVGPRLSGTAEHAYQSLLQRHARRGTSNRRQRRSTGSYAAIGDRGARRDSASPHTDRDAGFAAKFLTDGLRAESRGAVSIAKNYYRVAAKLGSKTAQHRYDLLARREAAAVRRR